jgi:hypothetical protein
VPDDAQSELSPQPSLLPGIVLLIAAVVSDSIRLEIGDVNLRPEIVVGALLAVWYSFRGGLAELKRAGIIEWCILGWLFVSALSSLLFSPQPGVSLRLTVLLAGLVMLYFVGLMLFRSRDAVVWGGMVWVTAGMVVASLAVIAALTYIAFGWTLGITLEANYQGDIFSVTPKVHSTLWEPNILGSYSLTVGMLAFALGCAPAFRSPKWQWWSRIGVALAFCGVMLSMTRTAWAVAALLLVLMSALSLWLKVVNWRGLLVSLLLPALVGLGVGIALGYSMPTASVRTTERLSPQEIAEVYNAAVSRGGSSPSQGSAITERLSGLWELGEVSSFTGRGRIYALALQGWLERPLLGWGTGAFAFYDTGGDKWIGNLELHVLFDTGIVGFLLLATAVGVAVWRGVRALKVPIGEWDALRYMVGGLLAGALGLFFTYQFTEGSWLGLSWVFFALLVSAVRHAGRNGLRAPATVE